MIDTRLYILMRSDMVSMNPGKAMAQAAHAANAFIYSVDEAMRKAETAVFSEQVVFVRHWQRQTSQGFGTTITLEVPSEKELHEHVATAQILGLFSGVVHDPTYPVRDGKITHLIPVDTCGYVFVPNPENLPSATRQLSLHS